MIHFQNLWTPTSLCERIKLMNLYASFFFGLFLIVRNLAATSLSLPTKLAAELVNKHEGLLKSKL